MGGCQNVARGLQRCFGSLGYFVFAWGLLWNFEWLPECCLGVLVCLEVVRELGWLPECC